MINHARTLLLNRARRHTHYSDDGYEYVPPEFKPVELPPTLAMVRQILFGSAPDNYFLNYRCRELLSYIHTTDLAEYIYKFDKRVTYWPETHKPFFAPAGKRISITQMYGQPQKFTVVGNLKALNSLGRANCQYTIDLSRVVAENDDIVLQLKLQQIGSRSAAAVVAVGSLDTPPILVLPNTEIKLRLDAIIPPLGVDIFLSERNDNMRVETYTPGAETNLAIEPPTIRRIMSESDAIMIFESYSASLGNAIYTEDTEISTQELPGLAARWFVETKAAPEPILPTAISALEMIGEPASIELFGFKNEEPYLTFKNLWFDHPLPMYKLAGIVLALIYRTEELRGQ